MDIKSKIYIAGHTSAVGLSIIEKLRADGCENIVTYTHKELDLTRQSDVEEVFARECFDYVFLLAAAYTDISDAINSPAKSLFTNTSIQNNVLYECYKNNVKKVVFFASCAALPEIAPDGSDRPLTENDIFTANLSKSLEPYALGKLCGVKLCSYFNYELKENRFISALPCHIIGKLNKPSALVLSLIAEFHNAKVTNAESVSLWGDPYKKYQILHHSDVAEAAITLMREQTKDDIYIVSDDNVYTKLELGEIIKNITGFKGEIIFDKSKAPSLSSSREVSCERMKALGWSPKIGLQAGIEMMYEEYKG